MQQAIVFYCIVSNASSISVSIVSGVSNKYVSSVNNCMHLVSGVSRN